MAAEAAAVPHGWWRESPGCPGKPRCRILSASSAENRGPQSMLLWKQR